MIGSGFYLPDWFVWVLYAIVYAPYWIPLLIVGAAGWLFIRRRRSRNKNAANFRTEDAP